MFNIGDFVKSKAIIELFGPEEAVEGKIIGIDTYGSVPRFIVLFNDTTKEQIGIFYKEQLSLCHKNFPSNQHSCPKCNHQLKEVYSEWAQTYIQKCPSCKWC